MTSFAHRLDRSVVIRATPAVVFRYFTDTVRWASWWGAGSTIDPRPGGRVLIRYPGGIEVAGEVLELEEPRRLVFTYGFVSGTPIPAGSSVVTIRLEPSRDGTELHLSHAFQEAAVRDEHVQGWRYQLGVFSSVVTSEVNGQAERVVDAWFDAWAETDVAERGRRLAAIAVPGVRFSDRFGVTDGIDDLLPHVSAAQRFMPGVRLTRTGTIRQSQGVVLADWIARAAEAGERGRGTNVFIMDPEGRIESVTGFWSL
ncbi:MAG TPA: SRPBCC domain-containing protein [Vicinamibacterales bacterium]|nr:SRPBCC domain-containing protein [Vicinamibacterales bacterium]